MLSNERRNIVPAFLAVAAFVSIVSMVSCRKDRLQAAASPEPTSAALPEASPSPAEAPADGAQDALNGAAPSAAPAASAAATSKPAVKTKPTGQVAISALGFYDISTLAYPPMDGFEAYSAWMKANAKDQAKYLKARWDRLAQDNIWHPESSIGTRRAFLMTPREEFVRSYNLANAYAHAALPIEDGQTISGPHLVTRMTHTIDPKPGMKVLEIGTGSGYQAAVLSFMTDLVYTIEIKPNLFSITDTIYRRLEKDFPTLRNVRRMNADGYFGWEAEAPFDRIIVTCGIDHIPPALLRQLSADGIMVIPIGPMNGEQVILKITKRVAADGTTTLEREDIYGGKVVQAFVPFTASDGSWHQEKK